MAYNDLNCSTNFQNTGLQVCNEDLGYWSKLILTPTDFEIDTASNAILEATWKTAINDDSEDRIRPFPQIKFWAENSEETQYEDGIAGSKIFVREGRYDVNMILAEIAFCLHKKLRGLNNGKWSYYIVTSNGYILGYTLDGTKFLPFSADIIRVEKQMLTDGTTALKTPVRIVGSDATEWNDNGVWVKPTAFNPINLDGIHDVILAYVGSATSTTATISVITTCDNVDVIGLVVGDFQLLNSSLVSQTINTVTDNDDGTYTLAYDALAPDSYTFNLKAPKNQTTKGYESTGSLSYSEPTTTPS